MDIRKTTIFFFTTHDITNADSSCTSAWSFWLKILAFKSNSTAFCIVVFTLCSCRPECEVIKGWGQSIRRSVPWSCWHSQVYRQTFQSLGNFHLWSLHSLFKRLYIGLLSHTSVWLGTDVNRSFSNTLVDNGQWKSINSRTVAGPFFKTFILQ